MPLPRKLLTEGETVIVELRPTWLVLGWPLVAVIGAAALAIVVVVSFPTAPSAVGYLMLAILLVAAGWLAVRALRWHTTSIVLTNRRILERRGVLSRSGVEIRLDRINELSYRQTLLERIVRTGSLVLEVGGETGVVLFNHLPQPAAVQSLVTEQIDNLRRGGWQPSAAPPGVTLPGAGPDAAASGTCAGGPDRGRAPGSARRSAPAGHPLGFRVPSKEAGASSRALAVCQTFLRAARTLAAFDARTRQAAVGEVARIQCAPVLKAPRHSHRILRR